MRTPQQCQVQRHALLGLLYVARQAQPDYGWIALADLRDATGDCAFALSVLLDVGHIKCQTFRYRITGDGVLAYEQTPEH